MGTTLFAFDFDETLVDGTAETWVGRAAGSGAVERVQADMSDWWYEWREFVNRLMVLLHSEGVSREDILQHLKKLRIYDQAMTALRAVEAAEGTHAIIISDSNSVFIDCILQECGVAGVFRAVLTNPASFSSEGRLSASAHHSHHCQRCTTTPNMCKGTILRDYLASSPEKYSRVVYVGDGLGDLCPLLQLGRGDVGVVRKGYGLERALAQTSHDIAATVHVVDFLQHLGDFITQHCL